MLKVVHIHRKRAPNAFSIEALFRSVAVELRKQIEVIEYEAGPRTSMFEDAWHLRKMNADIYHVTGDIHYIVLLLPWKKTVLTVHDIIHYLHDLRGIKRWIYKCFWLIWPIRAARAVTAISSATVEQLVEHLAVSRDRIIKIDNCYNHSFKHMPRVFQGECPVILQVGTRPNKNVPRLISALRGILCKLILIGKLDDGLRRQLRESGINYENRVNLTDAELIQAYVDCDIVAFISTAEGFGVPIIEAQASGRALITSNISPMSEVAGAGACLVPPLEVSRIREGILRIINDDVYRDSLVTNGIGNVARYSPQTISGHYLALYARLTNTKVEQ